MLELVENARASIDELMNEAARGFVEQLLVLSARRSPGPSIRVGAGRGALAWQPSRADRLAERKLAVSGRGCVRRAGRGREVAIPVYERLQAEARLGERIRDILVRGVSTRKYAEVLPRMAGTVGIAKSRCRGGSFGPPEAHLKPLMGRRFDELDILAVWIDGIVVADHHILAAVGVDAEGRNTCWGWRRAPVRTRGWSRICSRA